MHIEHVALWARDLEALRMFYETYFQATAGNKYINAARQFESYFLTFPSGARLELMWGPDIAELADDIDTRRKGYVHLAFSVGSEARVDALTLQLQKEGYRVIDGPRHTGDGYYESVILDPEGNRVEITI